VIPSEILVIILIGTGFTTQRLTMLDGIILGAGGTKKLYGERVPFSMPFGDRRLIHYTLDSLAYVDAKRIVITSDDPERMKEEIMKRSTKDNNNKPIDIVPGTFGLGTNALAGLYKLAENSSGIGPFTGKLGSELDYYKYIVHNPKTLELKVMATGCDIPLASPHKINECIARYEHAVENYGAEMTVLFTKKTYVNKVVNIISKIVPDFKDKFTDLDSTAINYQRLSKKKARISNIFFMQPFRANWEVYDIADQLYMIRYISHPKNWPKIYTLAKKYKDNTDIHKNALGFVSSITRLIFSSEYLLNSRKKNLGNVLRLTNKVLNLLSLGGCSAEQFSECVRQVSNLRGYVDFEAGFGTFIDIDDEETAKIVSKNWPTIRALLKKHDK